MDPGISKRIHQFDFAGSSEQLSHLLGNFDSDPPSNMSLMRLQIFPYGDPELRGLFARFPFSFPKLSHLDLGNFLPDSSSPIFTTSSLTSLKLFLPYRKEDRYTPLQFSQILQQHPNLQELELNHGAIPLPGPSSAPAPFTLPRLVSLRLHGMEAAISGLIDLIDMSSPLHDVVIRFARDPESTVPAFAGAVGKILVGYYECQGLDYPRKIDHFTISYRSEEPRLVFNAQSGSGPKSNPRSNLELLFDNIYEHSGEVIVKDTLPLFPLNGVRVFTTNGPPIYGRLQNLHVFRKMIDVSHLRLNKQDISPALLALSHNLGAFRAVTKPSQLTHARTAEPDQRVFPKLESLTLSYLDILFGHEEKLLAVLKGRRDCNIGLKNLVIQSCRVHKVELRSKLRKLVKEVKWVNVNMVELDCEDTDDDCQVGRCGCGELGVRVRW